MPKLVPSAIDDLNREFKDAKEFWSNTDFQSRTYRGSVPVYAETMAELVASIHPESVFEFGCNSGRNLALIREKLKAFDRSARLVGVDINEQSIEFGRREWSLDLGVADENSLSRLSDEEFDAIFTISVLDHIPAISETCKQLVRVCKRYLFVFEPCLDDSSYKVGRVQKDELQGEGTDTTPYSYIHNYEREFFGLPVVKVYDGAFPAYAANLGPFYRLKIYQKAAESQLAEWLKSVGPVSGLEAYPNLSERVPSQETGAKVFVGLSRDDLKKQPVDSASIYVTTPALAREIQALIGPRNWTLLDGQFLVSQGETAQTSNSNHSPETQVWADRVNSLILQKSVGKIDPEALDKARSEIRQLKQRVADKDAEIRRLKAELSKSVAYMAKRAVKYVVQTVRTR